MIIPSLRILILILISLAATVSVTAQNAKSQVKPDLSGTWKLDPSKGNAVDIGKRGEMIKIVHSEPEL